jgi:hypothetical protein
MQWGLPCSGEVSIYETWCLWIHQHLLDPLLLLIVAFDSDEPYMSCQCTNFNESNNLMKDNERWLNK